MMFQRLRKYFNKLQVARAEKKAFYSKAGLLQTAIEQSNVAAADKIYGDIKDSELFHRGVLDGLLKASIQKDNLAIFSLLFSGVKDQNYIFYSHASTGIEGPRFYKEEHILHAAIMAGSEAISLALANNPQVDVQLSGYSEMISFSSGRRTSEKEEYALPIDLAHQKGMHAVEEALAARISLIYLQKAVAAKNAGTPPIK